MPGAAVPYPWRHHTEGTRNFAMCSTCGQVITEWRQPWGIEGVPSRNHDAIHRHLADCQR